MSDQISNKALAEDSEKAELRQLISRLLDRVEDVRTLKRIYSFTDKLYCESGR